MYTRMCILVNYAVLVVQTSDFIFLVSGRYYKIVSSSDNYSAILAKLRDEGINFETDNGSELLPISPVEVCR